MNHALSLTGLLYWRVDLWTQEPWRDVYTYLNTDGRKYPGEGMLLYPRAEGMPEPAPSLRLKWIRDGVDDYDYIAILKGLGCGEAAAELVSGVAVSWSEWSQDPVKLERHRDLLGAMAERASVEGGCLANPAGVPGRS